MSPGQAAMQANSDTLEMTLNSGDYKLVRVRRSHVELYQLNCAGRWKRIATMGEVEAADLDSKLDELLRQ